MKCVINVLGLVLLCLRPHLINIQFQRKATLIESFTCPPAELPEQVKVSEICFYVCFKIDEQPGKMVSVGLELQSPRKSAATSSGRTLHHGFPSE